MPIWVSGQAKMSQIYLRYCMILRPSHQISANIVMPVELKSTDTSPECHGMLRMIPLRTAMTYYDPMTQCPNVPMTMPRSTYHTWTNGPCPRSKVELNLRASEQSEEVLEEGIKMYQGIWSDFKRSDFLDFRICHICIYVFYPILSFSGNSIPKYPKILAGGSRAELDTICRGPVWQSSALGTETTPGTSRNI